MDVDGPHARQRHADGDALAMHEAGAVVTGRGFERMAECVPEIEQGAVAGLRLVARDDRRLGGAARGDGMFALGSAGEDALPVGLSPVEE